MLSLAEGYGNEDEHTVRFKPTGEWSGRVRGQCAFTLVELLVAVAIIAVLVSLLLPALSSVTKSGRTFRCQVALRAVAFDFVVFADEELHGDRGNDEQLGPKEFRLETFQESEYGIDEFWRYPGEDSHELPDADKNDPMRCAEIRGPITLRRGLPCRQGAVGPPQNISFGFNLRMHWFPGEAGKRPRFIDLTQDVIGQELIPLAWDVDGAQAKANGANPVFSAPRFGRDGEKHWYPALRHSGRANFAFTDGAVRSSRAPLDETGWMWDYVPLGY